jgi:hypothetical protein
MIDSRHVNLVGDEIDTGIDAELCENLFALPFVQANSGNSAATGRLLVSHREPPSGSERYSEANRHISCQAPAHLSRSFCAVACVRRIASMLDSALPLRSGAIPTDSVSAQKSTAPTPSGSTYVLSKDAIPRVNYRVRRRRYADTPFLIYQNDWYEIDELADSIWLACEHGLTVEAITKAVATGHGLPLGEALAATVGILERFRALGFVELPDAGTTDL